MEPVTIAAIITAASTLGAGSMNLTSNMQANKENLALAKITRKDTLAAQRATLKMAERKQSFDESESALNRKEGLEQKGYARLQSAYQRAADLMTRQINMNQAVAAPFQKYAGGR